MQNLRALALFIMILAIPTIASAQKGKPSPTPAQVISAKFVYCPAANTDCESANRVRQDADRAYVNGSEGVAISFNVGVSGDLTINLNNSTRSVIYDLREMVHMGNPQPTWTSSPRNLKLTFNALKAYNAKSSAACVDGVCEGNYVTGMNGGGYTIDGVTYRTQWNPGSAQPYINYVEPTSPVNVHYRKDSTGETWTLTPIQKDNYYYLAGLQGETRKTITFGGQYNMPFSLTVTVK